jgi:hypothetical protein
MAPVRADAAAPTQVEDFKVKRLPTVRGQVVGPDGKPVAQAVVVDGTYHRIPLLTDKNGRFEYQMLSHEPFLPVRSSHLTERLTGSGVALLEDLQDGKELHIQLQPESEIRGTVLNANGWPRSNVPVWLYNSVKCGRWSMSSTAGSSQTDGQGRYRFRGLTRGERFCVSLSGDIGDRKAVSPWVTSTEKPLVLDPLKAGDELVAPKVEQRVAPELQCRAWINSPPLKMESLRGKVVFLHFWATWSRASVEDLATVQRAHELYSTKGLVVVGIHEHVVHHQDVRELVTRKGLTYAIGHDGTNGPTAVAYDVLSYPRGILIGRDGKIMPASIQNDKLLSELRQAVLYGRESE